jgi:hypothetical protein
MMHIGEPDYFARIQNIIDGHDGFAVIYEGLRKSNLKESERAILKGFMLPTPLVVAGKKLLGIIHQNEGLTYRSHWINTDLSARQLARALKKHGVQPLKEVEDHSWCEERPVFTMWVINYMLSNLIPVLVLTKGLDRFSRHNKTDDTIIHRRNACALEIILSKSTIVDVVTLWGASHLEGIDAGIRSNGFIEEQREWLDVYRLRKCRIQDVGEEFISSLFQKQIFGLQ